MAVTLNEQQRAAADLTHNAVVAAGAGSGKTTVLAERYLRLITQERLPVEKILCLTFTKKAANEMRRRIYRELRTFAHDAPEGGKAAAEAAVRGFYGARIQTLDSYCAQVVRSAASRYGISPDFSEDAERARAIIDEEALPFLLGCGNHPALSVLYQVKKIDEIAEGFFVAPLKNYASIDDDGSFTGGIVRQFKHISQQDTWQEDIQVVNECLDVINAQKYGADGIYTEKLNISFDELSAYFAMIQECTEHECIEKSYNHAIYKKMIHYLIMLYHICEISLVKTKGDAKDALKTIRRRFMRLSALFVFCAQAGFMYALSHLQQRFFDIIVERKRREGVLDFKDAAVLARKILIEQKDIRQSEKSAFSAIIIDEFQDNNELQKDMLFLLAEKEDICGGGVPAPEDLCPSKLFFVGDEKQSIYKFRGADVSVFRALQRTFGGSFPLSANYRSNERLIAAFNAIFGGLLPEGGGDSGCPAVFIKSSGGGGGTVNNLRKSEGGDAPLAPAAAVAPSSAAPHAGALPPQRPRRFPAPAGSGCAAPDFEAVYEPLSAGSGVPPGGTAGVPAAGGGLAVCVLPAAARGGADAESGAAEDGAETIGEAEARFTAAKIKSLIAAGRRPGDIAVLTRAHSKEYIFEKHLRKLNIPYTNENRSGIISIDPIQDIISVLRLSVYPMDMLCYASFLRSPFAGLSLAAAAQVLDFYTKPDVSTEGAGEGGVKTLFCAAAAESLNSVDTARYANAALLYAEVCEKTKTHSIAELTGFLWYDAGYRYEVEWHEETAGYRELFDVLYALAVKADKTNMSLAAWTDMIKAMQRTGKFKRLIKSDGWLDGLDIPVERENAVSILTIHKAKGLEFPVVFITGSGGRGRSAASADVSKTKTLGLAINPPPPLECYALKPDKYKKNYFYEAGRDEETAKSTAELRRLLYVGMTRAESELYITGTLACVQDVWKTINEDTDAGEIIRRVYESKLKRQEKKIEDGELRIQGGDTIIHDDTFFGLLLPSLAHIGPGRYFSCERIQESPPAPQKTGIPNTGDGRASFLRAAEAAYHHAAVLEKPPPRYLRAAVSALSGLPLPDGLCFTAAEEFSGEPAAAVFETIDTLFGRPPSAGIAGDDEGVLGAAALGTLVHRALEARLKNEEFAMPPQFAALLVEAEEKAVTAACADIAETFLNGPLGRRAAAARRRESELPFRMNVPPPLAAATPLLSPDATIDGVIDLVFETDNTIYIVDFKTGRLEMPEQYGWQMLLYRQAAINLWGKDSSPFLYYLRSGCAYRLNALLPKNPPDRSVRVRYGDIP